MYFFVFVAVVLAAYYLVAALRRGRTADVMAFVLWAAYAVYEYFVANGTLCDPYCNIRVDLVLFLPILGWASYLARGHEQRNGAVAIFAVVCLALAAGIASILGYPVVAVVAGVAALVVGALALRSRIMRNRA